MEKRTCSKCGTEKEVEQFQPNVKYASGRSTWCKSCHKSASKLHRRKRAAADPDYHKNRALEKHHWTPEQYSAKLSEQDGHCALCLSTLSNNGERLSVDHDHTICPGKYACDKCRRGLLCSTCNARLGYLEQLLRDFPSDQAEIYLRNTAVEGSWTQKALRYLKHYSGLQWSRLRTQDDSDENFHVPTYAVA